MSPARLSLSTVASPHCRLLFHLAAGIFGRTSTKVVRAAQNQASVTAHTGAGNQATVLRFRSWEKYFLDIPLYRSGFNTQISTSFDSAQIVSICSHPRDGQAFTSPFPLIKPALLDSTMYYFPTPRNFPICSFKNFSSAGLPPAPAVCPHKDGMGTSETFGMNPASYCASPTGKYRSVSDGI